MRYRIKTHQDFDKEFKRLCKKYSSLKADLSALGKSLSENPDQGTSLAKAFAKGTHGHRLQRKRKEPWGESDYLHGGHCLRR